MTNAKKAKAERREREARRKRPALDGALRLWLGIAAGAAALILVAVLVTSGGGTGGGGGASVAPPGSVTVDGPALTAVLPAGAAIPDWSAPSLDGTGTVSWSDYAGKPAVLSVWASWCPHCQVELPRLSAAVAAHPGIALVSITTAQGREPGPTPAEYMAQQGLSFPVGVDDAQTTLMRAMGVQGFPTVYYVDSQGKVVTSTEGEVPSDQLTQILIDLANR